MHGLSTKIQLVKMFIDNTPIAYVILDRDYKICYINRSFAELRNLEVAMVMGDKCYNVSNNGVRCVNCAVKETFSTGEKAFVSRKDILSDGRERFIDDYAIPLQKNHLGEVEFVLEIMIDRTNEMSARNQKNKNYDEIFSVLTYLIEAKDMYTAEHSQNVRKLSINLAREMKLPSDEIFEIAIAASLHDIGKVFIPDEIINKPGSLTDEEFNIIRKHPENSYEILEGISSFDKIREIARYHHERVDGGGYPKGIVGEDIPLGARIIAVADTYDAITTTRSYRKAQSHQQALAEIRRVAGTQLDTSLAEVFSNMDFLHMSDELYTLDEMKKDKQVERVLSRKSSKDNGRNHEEDINFKFDQNKLLKEIFQNTPCGYVFMERSRKVLYASQYFLDYMGLKEQEVLNKICYESGRIGSSPCENCPLERALETKKPEYVRQKQHTENGIKIFDMYIVPLIEQDGIARCVIEVVIDRTKEVMLEDERQQDLKKIYNLLKGIFSDKKSGISKEEFLKHQNSFEIQ